MRIGDVKVYFQEGNEIKQTILIVSLRPRSEVRFSCVCPRGQDELAD